MKVNIKSCLLFKKVYMGINALSQVAHFFSGWWTERSAKKANVALPVEVFVTHIFDKLNYGELLALSQTSHQFRVLTAVLLEKRKQELLGRIQAVSAKLLNIRTTPLSDWTTNINIYDIFVKLWKDVQPDCQNIHPDVLAVISKLEKEGFLDPTVLDQPAAPERKDALFKTIFPLLFKNIHLGRRLVRDIIYQPQINVLVIEELIKLRSWDDIRQIDDIKIQAHKIFEMYLKKDKLRQSEINLLVDNAGWLGSYEESILKLRATVVKFHANGRKDLVSVFLKSLCQNIFHSLLEDRCKYFENPYDDRLANALAFFLKNQPDLADGFCKSVSIVFEYEPTPKFNAIKNRWKNKNLQTQLKFSAITLIFMACVYYSLPFLRSLLKRSSKII